MNELFDKYNLTVASNGMHLYKEDLSARDMSLECTTPISFSYKGITIEETAWKKFSPKVINFLFSISSKTKDEALAFRTDWTRQPFFYEGNVKANLMPLDNGLYLNCNFTALHSVWCLQDCLDFFEIPKSDCTLIIHRPSAAEPDEIRKYFKEERTLKFRQYLAKIYGYDDERCSKVIQNIDYLSKKFLPTFSKSYDDFFLFDTLTAFYNYSDRMPKAAHDTGKEKFEKQVQRYMLFLKGFYSAIY